MSNSHAAPSGKYVARRGVAPSPDAEILGTVMLLPLHNFRAGETAEIVRKHLGEEIQPDQWYPMQKQLDIIKDIDAGSNPVEAHVALGMQFMEAVPFPPEVAAIPEALEVIAHVFRNIGRNLPEAFGAFTKKVGERHYLLLNNTPYPTEELFGLVWAVANRFKPPSHV